MCGCGTAQWLTHFSPHIKPRNIWITSELIRYHLCNELLSFPVVFLAFYTWSWATFITAHVILFWRFICREDFDFVNYESITWLYKERLQRCFLLVGILLPLPLLFPDCVPLRLAYFHLWPYLAFFNILESPEGLEACLLPDPGLLVCHVSHTCDLPLSHFAFVIQFDCRIVFVIKLNIFSLSLVSAMCWLYTHEGAFLGFPA